MYYFLCNVPVSVKSVQISKPGLVEGQLKAVLLYCTINMFRHFSFKKKKKKLKETPTNMCLVKVTCISIESLEFVEVSFIYHI